MCRWALPVLVLAALSGLGTRASDRVTYLPGIGVPDTPTYSGLLLANAQYGGYLYYYFAESQGNPDTDPVILWLQGGPGDSSLFGTFVENGPYVIDGTGSWRKNPYSWNTNASMLWIDNPVGTGFSFVMNASGYVRNESALALDLATALTAFFRLHSQYSSLPFYIFGESYAGKYVPWLADTIMKRRIEGSSLHVSGIGLGNGWVSPTWQTPSNPLYLLSRHRITSAQVAAANTSLQYFLGLLSAGSYLKAEKLDDAISTVLCIEGGIEDPFDIRYDHDPSEAPWLALLAWLQTEETKSALNVAGRNFSNGDVPYDYLDVDEEESSLDVLARVVSAIPTLLYNGECDLICNYIGTSSYALAMRWPGSAQFRDAPWVPWVVSAGADEAGAYKSAMTLTQLVVARAGHMSPYDQPANVHNMLFHWLRGGFNSTSCVSP